VLGALALGAQRLLPALQQSYSAWASIAGNHASLDDTIELLDQPLPAELLQPAPAPLLFQKDIQFRGVRFRYANDGPWVLDGLNLVIVKGARVGFVGSTGSGKSTTLDLLMGLLMPTEGELLVDGQPISGIRVKAWQQTIAHVPQSIYLADTTLAENIAFGVPPDTIDLDRVRQAARQAQIADFIESSPEGYQAYVGERGIRLSGGQRQRIGIARALYKQASVLVFDEATSALDNATEQSVMDAIEGLSSDLTILLIAHRLTTVRRCDTIVELEHGQVVAQGSYEQLLECSPSFRSMARAAG
jgi:ATP-binding cassette subfamily B protein